MDKTESSQEKFPGCSDPLVGITARPTSAVDSLPSISHIFGIACQIQSLRMGFSQTASCDSSSTSSTSTEVDKSELTKVETKKQQLSDVAMSKAVTSDKIWWIHGNGYDLSKFVERHPGGKEAILLGRGRDCTALFESYHIFSNEHWYVL